MNESIIEEEDFYYNDEGLMVLTEKFHLKKGFCCGNGCLHCTYEYIGVSEPRRSALLASIKTKNVKDVTSKTNIQ